MVSLLLSIALLKAGPADLSLTVDGVERKAIVYRSSVTDKASPVVFVWHGFTGSGRHAAFAYKVHEAWPEATVVYPQGLDVELLNRKAPGWQIAPKMQGDRDLKFYDKLLEKMKSDYKADTNRVYTCGMSNGAIFSYLLVTERSKTLAAAAPVAGFASPAFRGAAPMPLLIVHGKTDELIRLQAAERSRDLALSNNRAEKAEKEWAPGYVLYTPSKDGKEVVWRLHDGGHTWPSGTTEAIVRFFKAHSRG